MTAIAAFSASAAIATRADFIDTGHGTGSATAAITSRSADTRSAAIATFSARDRVVGERHGCAGIHDEKPKRTATGRAARATRSRASASASTAAPIASARNDKVAALAAAAPTAATAISVRTNHSRAASVTDPEIARYRSAAAGRAVATIWSRLTITANRSRQARIATIAPHAASGPTGACCACAAIVCSRSATIASSASVPCTGRAAAISARACSRRIAGARTAVRSRLTRSSGHTIGSRCAIARGARDERVVAQGHAAAIVAIHRVIRDAGHGGVERFDGQTVERRRACNTIAFDGGDAAAADGARLNRHDVGRASCPIVLRIVSAVNRDPVDERNARVVNPSRNVDLGFTLLSGLRQRRGQRKHRLLPGTGIGVASRNGYENSCACVTVDSITIGIGERIIRKIRAGVLTLAPILRVAIRIEIPRQTRSKLARSG